ncbi:SET domain-containing protein [Laetiporus sulphureus 93-53]|uniref:SET domain-containing protein n=1 Tax=Laetiporus sulphureus 93-53 TaxID=1314785 RepID=A0A165IMS7_9APHY|nr:SET domain-containing protein [Laetiporus sulphureus 93-53]KZT13296.1 SET domain-containing protein [Laetiporus sulphureus 93-53]
MPDQMSAEGSKPRFSPRAQILQQFPRVVSANPRLPGMPCFLYLADSAEGAEMVVIDYLKNIKPAIKVISACMERPLPYNASERCFRICPIEGKGLGMIATRDIRAGELIFAERPTYVSNSDLYTRSYDSPYADATYYSDALAGLSEHSRQSLLSLYDAYDRERMEIVPGIVGSNVFQISVPTEEDYDDTYSGVFLTLSRSNHDCTPNTNYHFSRSAFCGQFFAAVDIAAGDEISVIYTDELTTCDKRRAHLRNQYGFTCVCRVCSLPEHPLYHSDARRVSIHTFLKACKRSRGDPPNITLDKLQLLLMFTRAERLPIRYAQVLYMSAEILLAHGNAELAFDWVKESRRAFCLTIGEDSWMIEKVDDLGRQVEEKLRRMGIERSWEGPITGGSS